MHTGYNQFWMLSNCSSQPFPQENYQYRQIQSNSQNLVRNDQNLNQVNYAVVDQTTAVYQDGRNMQNNNWMTNTYANVSYMPEQIPIQQKQAPRVIDNIYFNSQIYQNSHYNYVQTFNKNNNNNNIQADWLSQIPPHVMDKNLEVNKANNSGIKQYKNIQPQMPVSNNGNKTFESPKIRVKDVSTLNRPFENQEPSKTFEKERSVCTLSSLIAQKHELEKSRRLPLQNNLGVSQAQPFVANNYYQGGLMKNVFWPTENQNCEQNVQINNTLPHLVNNEKTNQSGPQNANYLNNPRNSIIKKGERKVKSTQSQVCNKNSRLDNSKKKNLQAEKTCTRENPGRVSSVLQFNNGQIEAEQVLETQSEKEASLDPYPNTTFSFEDFNVSNNPEAPCSVGENVPDNFETENKPIVQSEDLIVPKSEPVSDNINDSSLSSITVKPHENVQEKVQSNDKITVENETIYSNKQNNYSIIKENVNKTDKIEVTTIDEPSKQNSETQTKLLKLKKNKKKKKKKKRSKENSEESNINVIFETDSEKSPVSESDKADVNSKNISSPSFSKTKFQEQSTNTEETKFTDIDKLEVSEDEYKTKINRKKLDLLIEFIEKDIDVKSLLLKHTKERKNTGVISSVKRKRQDNSPTCHRRKISKESVVKNKKNSKKSVSITSHKPPSEQKCCKSTLSTDFNFKDNKIQNSRSKETVLHQKEDNLNNEEINSGIENEEIYVIENVETSSMVKEKSSKQKDLDKTKDLALREQNKLKNICSVSEEDEKSQSVRRDSTKENFDGTKKDKSRKCESPKTSLAKVNNVSSKKIQSDFPLTKDATFEEDEIFQTIKSFQKSRLHYCKNCEMNSSSDSFWVNAVSGDVKCVNCFKLEAGKTKMKKIKYKEKEMCKKSESKHSRESKGKDGKKSGSKSTVKIKAPAENPTVENSYKIKSCEKTDKNALLAQLYKKTKKLSWTLLGET